MDRRERTNFLGLNFDQLEQDIVVTEIVRLAQAGGFSYVVTPNVDHVVRLHSRKSSLALWKSYQGATLCLCDSRILARLALFSGRRLAVVPGSDITVHLLERAAADFHRIGYIGGDEKVAHELARRYPAITWHRHDPPMGLAHNAGARSGVVEFVESCCADLFLFAVGSPQSELICAEIARRQKATGVAVCIGASLEFISGAKRRAPVWMQKASLEWLFRLISEPRRLWRRYLLEGPAIFRIWWAWHAKATRTSSAFGSNGHDGLG